LAECVKLGLAKSIGVSNYSREEMWVKVFQAIPF
jgi:diketogulonate reductase-like aldo/keto reductase